MKAQRILLASDTHGKIGNLTHVIRTCGPFDAFIFCGDGEGLEHQLTGLFGAQCACYLVRGNNDYASDLPDELVVPLGKERAFVVHGHRQGVSLTPYRAAELAADKGCRYCFYGHTHRPAKEIVDGVLCINPGSLSYPRQEDRRPSYTLIEVDEQGEPHFHMACVS